MNIKRILCPIDFSEYNQATNDYASMLAHANGAAIVYFHVSQPEVPYGSYSYVNMEVEEERDRKQLEEIKPSIDGIEALYVVEFGSPTSKIVEYAQDNEIDLIVMGTHGRTGLLRALMGSVAEAVVRKAKCPVLAVKSGASVPQTS